MGRLRQWVVGLALGAAGLWIPLRPMVGSGPTMGQSQSWEAVGETLKQKNAQAYTRAMLVGYAAAEQGDYHTALINFRRALAARPGDHYARSAIRNMETYIAQERAEAAKQAEILQLQNTLGRAVEANDWACAAATVDRLVMLVPPNSTDRARLIAYRGELAGFIQARDNLEHWSTICPGGRV